MRDIFIISTSKCKHHFNLNKKFPLPSSMVLFTSTSFSFVKQISVKLSSSHFPSSLSPFSVDGIITRNKSRRLRGSCKLRPLNETWRHPHRTVKSIGLNENCRRHFFDEIVYQLCEAKLRTFAGAQKCATPKLIEKFISLAESAEVTIQCNPTSFP